jgi:3,4-dihydroxy-2-butanone 4-phosphate synthase
MGPLDLVRSPAAPDAVALASEELAAGRMVLLRDDRERGGEGDLLVAAEFADAEAINFMSIEARGLVCLALSAERCEALGLEQIGPRGNGSSLGDSSMVSIEAREGVTTGIARSPSRSTRRAAPRTSSSPATSSRCARVPAACWSGRGGSRRRSSSPRAPACGAPPCSVR